MNLPYLQLACLAGAVAALMTSSAFADPDQPHIVVIMVDDMGYGDPGCFNSQSKIATPAIDSLARDGMKFTDAHAPGPLCHMSRYGLLTGHYPFRIDVKPWRQKPLIQADQMTIASLAKASGYRTAMVGKWHVGFRENGYDKPLPGGPVDRGFDSYFGIRASTDIPPYFYIRDDRVVEPPTNRIEASNSPDWSPIQGAFWREGGIAPDLQLEDVLPRFSNEAIQVIEDYSSGGNNDDQPLMLYLAYPAPHTPWLPSPEFAGRSDVGMYGDFMMMVDAEVGRVLTALDDAQMTADTILIFTSDNGPTWFDADHERFGHDSSGGLRGMKADAWEGGHRMPFIVRWPGTVPAGSSSDQLICFTDLLATFADLFNVDLPADAGPDSYSFLPALEGRSPQQQQQPQRDTFVMRAGSVATMMTIRAGDWKLITGVGSGGFSRREKKITRGPNDPPGQLYNLASDRAETDNLYAQHPDIVARLTSQLNRIVDAGRSRPLP